MATLVVTGLIIGFSFGVALPPGGRDLVDV